MTVCAAWVRKTKSGEELIFAADSRLSGARNLDYCPKILPLPRGDSAICFGGETDFAYPLMFQLAHAIESFRPSRTRAMDIRSLASYTVKIFNSMADAVQSSIPELRTPEVMFILGGYSSQKKEFCLWKIRYIKAKKIFQAYENKGIEGFGKVVFGGDRGTDAHRRLISLLKKRYNFSNIECKSQGFDMEPFEVIRDMLRHSNDRDSIGGAPQLMKVYQHLNTLPVGVYWPNRKDGGVTLLGRPLLGYEEKDTWIFDPDELNTYHPHYSPPEKGMPKKGEKSTKERNRIDPELGAEEFLIRTTIT